MEIRELFGPDGPIAARHPRYERRDGQVALAEAIDAALRDGRHLDAEAPAGVGKSFAYLVPLIRLAVERERPGLVVTANIALQEQLIDQDLPFLASVLPMKFRTALVKGLSNYLCLDRYTDAAESFPTDEWADVRAWAETTTSGDRSELETEPSRDLWRRICGIPELCNGSKCVYYDDCYAMAARSRARRADIIVTNYHLLFAHLRVRRETGEDRILPAFDWVVCDEAHEMADAAREFFGHRLTPFSVRVLLRGARLLGRDDLGRRLRGAGEAFFNRVESVHGAAPYAVRLKSPMETSDLSEELEASRRAVEEAAHDAKDPERSDALDKCLSAADAARSALRAFGALDDPNMVYWVERDDQAPSLRSELIDPGEAIRTELYDRASSVVAVSATLRAGGEFDFFVAERGQAPAQALVVPTPFNFREQCLLVVPDLGVEPNHPEFVDAMSRTINQILERLDGRTMALFTSYRNMERCARAAGETGLKILQQGDRPRTKLLEEFRRSGRGKALFATSSFWQGVDIPGDPLSCLIIDRIPFPPPDVPRVEAIGERDPDAFRTYSLPRATIDLRQGFGRLIRSRSDVGAVVIFDGRIFTKSYGRSILESLPDAEVTRDVDRIFAHVPPARPPKKGRR